MKGKSSKINRFKLYRIYIQFRNYITNNYSSFKNRILVFLIFILLSTTLWFYRTLEDTFIATIHYPVKYKNLPKNKILIGEPPNKIRLRVRSNGYTLLSSKLKFKKPLNFNINSFLLYSQANDSMSVYILTRFAQEALSEELSKKNSDLEIVSIQPDSIFFSFTRTKIKRVAIRPDLEIKDATFAKQHMQNGPLSLLPDSTDIIGPATIIDTIRYIYTKPVQPTELTDTFTKKLKIVKIDQINIPVESSVLSIPVDKYTELSYDIPILAKHVPDSINMKLFPRTAKLSFNIAYSFINKISDTDFRPYVDFEELNKERVHANRITVSIDTVPAFVHALRIYPSSVEYINELNNANSRGNRRNR